MSTNDLLKIAKWQFKNQAEIDMFYELVATIGLPIKSFAETPQFLIFKSDSPLENLTIAAEAVTNLGYSVERIAGTIAQPQVSMDEAHRPIALSGSALPEKALPPVAKNERKVEQPAKPPKPTPPLPRSIKTVETVQQLQQSKQKIPPPLPKKAVEMAPPLLPSEQIPLLPLPKKEVRIVPPPRVYKQISTLPLLSKRANTLPPPLSTVQATDSQLPPGKDLEQLEASTFENSRAEPRVDDYAADINFHGVLDDYTPEAQNGVTERHVYEGSSRSTKIIFTAIISLIVFGGSYFWLVEDDSMSNLNPTEPDTSLESTEDLQRSREVGAENVAPITKTQPSRPSVSKDNQQTPQEKDARTAVKENSTPSQATLNTANSLEVTPRPPSVPVVYETRGPLPSSPPANWFKLSDIPKRKMQKGLQTSISYSLSVGISGDVVGCRASESSPQGLSELFCAKVSSRAKFEPALGQNGKPVPGEFKSSLKINVTQQKTESKNKCAAPNAEDMLKGLC